ncbi:hypothetical protein [Methylobacterium sp. CM6247]
MDPQVYFKPTLLGDPECEEYACLGMFSGRIVAILIRSSEFDKDPEYTEWYLDKGFGLCDQQGLMFSSLEAAKSWITAQMEVNQT